MNRLQAPAAMQQPAPAELLKPRYSFAPPNQRPRRELAMLRLIIALLLVSASAHALALNNRAESVVPSCQATEAMGRDEPAQAAGIVHSKAASPVRSKTAKPAINPGGGGNDDDNQPRLRGSKWHSFLPGMFR
jgi:hypothetical protein